MKKALLVSLVFAVVFAIAGCGSEKKADTKGSPSASVSPSPSAGQSSAAKTELDDIKARGSLSIAMGGKYPPFNFMNASNELDGFDVDIANEIANRLGVKAKYVTSEWEGIIPGLLTNKYDIILASMAITEERLTKVNFVHYYTSGAAVIVPNDSKVNVAADLKGLTVGVALGTTYEKKAIELGAEVKTYSSSADALNDMVNGRVDGVIADKLLSTYAIKTKNLPFKIVGELLYTEKEGIAIRKEDTNLQQAIQDIMNEIFNDGTYEKISKKWFDIDIR